MKTATELVEKETVYGYDGNGYTAGARVNIVAAIKDAIRQPYAWPGGYEKFAITCDGGLLCPTCLRSEYQQICHDTLFPGWEGTGWSVSAVSCTANSEPDTDTCDHCSRTL